MPAKIYSAAIAGLDAQIVEVEVDVSFGLHRFDIVSLPDKAVQESKERVGAAIKSINLKPPYQKSWKVLVNLAPADLKKEGSFYDLPIALGFLKATNQINFNPEKKVFLGELSLKGDLRPLKGVLSFALECKKKGFKEIILPKENEKEAALISRKRDNLKIIGVESLKETIDYLLGKVEISSPEIKIEKILREISYPVELEWIKGQEYAKRALEITAGGAHNLLMIGPPGAGKTLLAKGICSILPRLSLKEALELTKIYSVAGLLPKEKSLINRRPFRAPHHISSEVALIGGGNPPRAGEITLAHRGILFLDEFPEFHRDVLESLRQPIEEGIITILRARHSLTLPAKFTLIAASNPCPCGYLNDPEKECTCTSSQIAKYRRKLSGPLMDRMDLFIEVPAVKFEKLISERKIGSSIKIRERVERARKIQKERFRSENKMLTNNEMNIPEIKKHCQVCPKSQNLLGKYVDSGKLSARGYHRVLKVARTIADLENSEKILYDHVSEALMYRIREGDRY